MKLSTVFALGIVITVVSFLGFITENVWLAATKGYIDNRNMTLPFLLGYGLAMVAIYLMLGLPSKIVFFGHSLSIKNKLLRIVFYFVCVMVCVSVGEILLGTLVEKTCNVVWWDYTRLPMHITKYTSIPTSIAFSTLITIFMSVFFEPLMNWALTIEYDTLRFSSITFMFLLTTDFILNAVKLYKTKELKSLWKIDTTNSYVYNHLHS